MDTKAHISVIVPVHNTGLFLRKCLDSILNQTFPHIEILCIDSSTDESTSILSEYDIRDKRVTHILDSNSSYGYKVNIGIKNAVGKYIAIVDSDDYIEPDMLEALYATAVKQQADLVKSNHTCFYVENGNIVLDRNILNGYRPFFYGKVFSAEEIPEILCLSSPTIWSGLYRREFLINNHIFLHESAGASYQDAGFSALTHVLAKRIYYLDRSFYRYRTDNANSSVKSQSKYKAVIDECNWLDEQLRKRGINDEKILDAIRIRKINTYFWNYERLDTEWRKRFCEDIHDDLEKNFVEGYSTEHWRPITKQRLEVLLTGKGKE